MVLDTSAAQAMGYPEQGFLVDMLCQFPMFHFCECVMEGSSILEEDQSTSWPSGVQGSVRLGVALG